MTAQLVLVILLAHPGLASLGHSASEDLQRKLESRVENYSLSEKTFLQALARVAAQFELPMGIEWIKGQKELEPIELSWRAATVSQIIQRLVESHVGYAWETRNGVVHVFPRGSPTDKRDFLNIQIDHFQVKDDFVTYAHHALSQRVRRIVSPPPPPKQGAKPGGGEASSMSAGWGDRKVSFQLDNATVRDILDQLSLAADFKVWIVTYPKEETFTAGGFRRVAGRDDQIRPDDEQPAWDMLMWGQDLFSYGRRHDWKPYTQAAEKKRMPN